MHKLYMLEEKLCKELEEVSSKELTKSNLEVIDLLTHAMKSLATYVAMKGSEESGGSYNSYGSYRGGSYSSPYDNRSFRGGGSYGEGSYGEGSYDEGSYRRGRDSMGRYSNEEGYANERGYSRGENDQFKSQLHELMAQAPSGTIRQELQKISSMAGQM